MKSIEFNPQGTFCFCVCYFQFFFLHPFIYFSCIIELQYYDVIPNRTPNSGLYATRDRELIWKENLQAKKATAKGGILADDMGLGKV